MITQDTIDAIKADIDMAAAAARTAAGVLAPEILPLIALGQIVAKGAPDLLLLVEKAIAGQPVTADELTAFASKRQALANPETL